MRAGRKQVWLAASVAAGVLALGVWALFFRSDSSRSIRRSVPIASLPAGRRPADLKVAMLFDCYAHALENVPPRWDTSSRDRNWKAPPPPLPPTLAALGDNEPQVRQWLVEWDERMRQGRPTIIYHWRRVEKITENTSLTFESLVKIGLAVSFLDNDGHASAWFRAALRKAAEEMRTVPPGDPRAARVLELLPQMTALRREGDYATLEKRFELERTLNPPGSRESRRAGVMLAEARFYQRFTDKAADVIMAVQAENDVAGDLTQADREEMHYEQGLMLYYAHRYAEAIPHLQVAAATHPAHRADAVGLLGLALLREKRVREAVALRSRAAPFAQTNQTVQMLNAELDAIAAQTPSTTRASVGNPGMSGLPPVGARSSRP